MSYLTEPAIAYDLVQADPANPVVAHFAVTVDEPSSELLISALSRAYPGSTIRSLGENSTRAIVVERGPANISMYVCPAGTGWAVVKGTPFDVASDRCADPAGLAAAFLSDSPDLNRFEGEFAAAVHDARREVTWLINDHASLIHLYYANQRDLFCGTTAPLAIARALGDEPFL